MKLKKPKFWDYKRPNVISYFFLNNSLKKLKINKTNEKGNNK